VQDPEYDNALRLDAIEHSVGKLRNERAPHLSMSLCEHFRILFDGVKGGIDGAEKPFAKAFDLLFVVRKGICKVPSDPASEDERQGH